MFLHHKKRTSLLKTATPSAILNCIVNNISHSFSFVLFPTIIANHANVFVHLYADTKILYNPLSFHVITFMNVELRISCDLLVINTSIFV